MRITEELFNTVKAYIREHFEKTMNESALTKIGEALNKPYVAESVTKAERVGSAKVLLETRPMSRARFDMLDEVPDLDLFEESDEDEEVDSSLNKPRYKSAQKTLITPSVCEDITSYNMMPIFAQAIHVPSGDEAYKEAIKKVLKERDESFKEMLFRKIDELGVTDAFIYKKAQLTRGHFNKIKNEKDYRPKKNTVVALGMALSLPRYEFDELLSKAGYTLNKYDVFDLIVGYFVDNSVYDLYTINDALLAFDQPLLGAGYRE